MPSQNTEGNLILMEWTDKANSEDDDLGQKVDVGDHYFLWRDTKDYFQTIKVDEAYVPLGDSKPMCIHIQWVKREMRKMVDKYRSVSAMGDCDNALNPKYRWQQSDPKTGVDVKPYTETSYYTEKESCKSGEVFVKALEHAGGKCFSYQIVKRICLMITFVEHPETASYNWEFTGGCYKQGAIGYYEDAVLGETYDFSAIPIEVREDESVVTVLEHQAEKTEFYLITIVGWISWLCFAASGLMLVAFICMYFMAWNGMRGGASNKHVLH
jgi:hypothetical protein